LKRKPAHKKKELKAEKRADTEKNHFIESLTRSGRPYLLIIIAGILVYGKTLWFDYTYFDDNILIIKKIDTLSRLSEIFQSFKTLYLGPYYRPIVTISLIFDAQVSSAAPWMYHISNLIIHLAAGCSAYYLFLKLQIPKPSAILGSIIFILHPLATQTVAWIPGRNDSLVALFIILSFIFFINSLSPRKHCSYFLHILFFYIALFTKESALIFPVILLLYYVIVTPNSLLSTKAVKYIIGWIPGIILWYYLRSLALANIKLSSEVFSLQQTITNLPALIEIVGKLVFPFNLSVYATITPISIMLGITAIAGATTFFILRKKEISRLMIFSLIWIVLFNLPSLIVNILDTQNRFSYLESRGYISIIGFAILAAGLYRMLSNSRAKKITPIIISVIIIYSTIVLIYSTSYRSPIDYWNKAVEMSPRTSDTYYNLGLVSSELYNNTDAAEQNFTKAISLNNKNSFYHNCLGVIYGQKNMIQAAENEFNASIKLNPKDPDPYVNLGYLKYINNQFPEAESCFKKSISLDSNYSNAYYKLIVLYKQLKRYDEALNYADILKHRGFELDSVLVEEIKRGE
jgi:protein O-mannosyl-transferase